MDSLIDADLGDFALFARVVEAGGFSAAARTIGVPQTTLSRRIAKLEVRLGVRLLERTTRRIAITEAGRKVFDHARRMMDEAEDARATAASLNAEPSGLIRVSAPVVLGQHLLAPAIISFTDKYPKVRFQVSLSGRRVDLVEEGYDIAIRVGDLPDSGLMKVPLMKSYAAYYARPDVAGRIRKPQDLSEPAWLNASNESGSATWNLLNSATGEMVLSLSKEPLITSSDVETLVQAARAGLGVSVLPEFVRDPKLVRVLPDYVARLVEINALLVSRKSIIPSVRGFIDHLKVHLQSNSTSGGGVG